MTIGELVSRARRIAVSVAIVCTILAAGCARDGGGSVRDQPRPASGPLRQIGLASFYGAAFEGRTTASGRIFDKDTLVAAHPKLPFGTRVRVTSFESHRSVVVRIVDRGPIARYQRQGVIIDVSERAAEVLGLVRDGRHRVKVEVLQWGRASRRRTS